MAVRSFFYTYIRKLQSVMAKKGGSFGCVKIKIPLLYDVTKSKQTVYLHYVIQSFDT